VVLPEPKLPVMTWVLVIPPKFIRVILALVSGGPGRATPVNVAAQQLM
jgi:hypothetical protein